MKISTLSKLSAAVLLGVLTSGAAYADSAILTDVTPTPGTSFGQNDTSGVTVFFEPDGVNIESAVIIFSPTGQTTTTTQTLSCSKDQYRPGHPWEIGLSENLLWHIATEQAAFGSTFDVVLYNVTYNGEAVTTSSLNNEFITFKDGNIILTYKVPDVKFELTAQEWPSVYYSDWSKTDALPTAVLTFNEDIKSVGNISYRTDNSSYGSEGGSEDVEYGDFPLDVYTITGNIVTIDFSKYTPEFIITPKVLSIYVTGILSITGQSLTSVPTGHMTYEDNSLSTGIDNIESISQENRYFNLQGQEVIQPAKGQILIRKNGEKTSKVSIR